MKTLIVLVLNICIVLANSDLQSKQEDVLRIVNYINQPTYYTDLIEIGNNFKFEDNWDLWIEPEHAKLFYKYYKQNTLPQGEIFSAYNVNHLKYAASLFRTLYYAKDYKTFHQIAAWARNRVNQGLFLYAYHVAVFHSEFTNGVIIPPIYELYPFYYINDMTIKFAQKINQEYKKEMATPGFIGFLLDSNYSQQSISYFIDDVGLNMYNFYQQIYSPTFLSQKESKFDQTFRGRYFIWKYQQLLARYYLERLSNGMGEIGSYSYDYPIETGYYPSLTYPNGLPFPNRPNNYKAGNSDCVNNYESRLRSAIDSNQIYTDEAKLVQLTEEILGNLIENNNASLNSHYFGNLLQKSRSILGNQYSALAHFATSLRDPIFWQLYKRVLSLFQQYQNNLNPYNNLNFKGVKINDVKVDKITTFFDYFETNIQNSVTLNPEDFRNDSLYIKARQLRLNHNDFNYKIETTSKSNIDALVMVFIGPKYDENGRPINIKTNRLNFFQLDRFHYKLQTGINIIERNSLESKYFSNDSITYREILESTGSNKFDTQKHLKLYGFPQRLIIPRGGCAGKKIQFYVIISPYQYQKQYTDMDYYLVDDRYSFGYPFDRRIEFEDDFNVSNSFFKDVKIYHKNLDKVKNAWTNIKNFKECDD